MNISELLDKGKTLEERVEILKKAYEDDFKELEILDDDIISQVSKAIEDLIKEKDKKITDLELSFQQQNRILNELDKVNIKELDSIGIRELDKKKKESKAKVDEIIKNKSRISINPDILDSLNQKRVNIANDMLEAAKKQTTDSMNYIRNNIVNLNNTINKYSSSLKEYYENEDELKDTLASLIDREDTPEKDELFNKNLSELEIVEEKILKCNAKILEYRKNLEEQEKNLAELQEKTLKQEEKEAKSERKETKANEKAEQKEQKREEKKEELNPLIKEFNEICSKEELSFFEKERRTGLYDILANSSVLEKEERQEIFDKYINSIEVAGKEIIGKCKDKMKPQKVIPIISSVKSMIAKGSIVTINKMEKVFDKVREISISIASKVVDKATSYQDNKVNKVLDKAEKLRQINDMLKNINTTNIQNDEEEIIEEPIDEHKMAM